MDNYETPGLSAGVFTGGFLLGKAISDFVQQSNENDKERIRFKQEQFRRKQEIVRRKNETISRLNNRIRDMNNNIETIKASKREFECESNIKIRDLQRQLDDATSPLKKKTSRDIIQDFAQEMRLRTYDRL